MDKIKILIVIGSLDYSNGITNYAINYYRKLDKNKFEIDFVVHDCIKNKFYDLIIENGGKVFLLDNIKFSKLPQIYKEVKKIMQNKKYDIVHCHLLNIAFLYFGLAKKYGIQSRIIHSHATKYAEKKTRVFRNMILGKIGIKMSTSKFACSNLAGKFLYKNKKFVIINNAINIDKFSFKESVRNKIRKNLKINNEIVIGHIGRFSEQKNHKFLVDLLYELNSKSSKYKLVLLGDGHLFNDIVEYSKNKGVYDDICFIGNVDNPSDYYNVFDLFALPSLFEGLPVVGIEAQANGLPCIFSDTITKELELNKNVYFFPISEVSKWQEQIENINLIRCNQLSYKLVNDYDINIQTEKLEKSYIDSIKSYKNERNI